MSSIGIPRQTSGEVVYDVPLIVTFHIPGLPDVIEEYPLIVYPFEGRWTGMLCLRFATMVEGDDPKAVIAEVRDRLTVDVKPEWRETEL